LRFHTRDEQLELVDRPAFVTGSIALIAAPLAAEAQPSPKVGYLSIGSASDPRRLALLGAFQQGLRELGYVEGKTILTEARFDEEQYDRLPDLTAELVRLKVDIIVAYATPAVLAAQNATRAIPIVMSGVVDPVRTGVVASLGRPGRNVTDRSCERPRWRPTHWDCPFNP
jgi:putative ABC transport system substrate-binding protein